MEKITTIQKYGNVKRIQKYGGMFRIWTNTNFYILSPDGSSEFESEEKYFKLLKSKFRPVKGPLSMSFYFKFRDVHESLIEAIKEGNVDTAMEYSNAVSLLEIRTLIKKIKKIKN